MCGRYQLNEDADEPEIQEIIEEVQRKSEAFKTGEIFPTDKVPILTGEFIPEAVTWGFPGFRGKSVIINARAETVPEKAMFRVCLRSGRCVIPSTGFFEWSHDGKKTKYRFNLPGTGVLYMAGLYRSYESENRFVILTTAANRSMEEVHSRMPVVLNRDGMQRWMTDETAALSLLSKTPPELVKEPV